MDKLITMNINGKSIDVEPNLTVLEAASKQGIYIPRLCYIKDLHETSACRVCAVEIEGWNGLKTACSTRVYEGMNVKTNSRHIRMAVRENLKLAAANHVFECWKCSREQSCEFLDLMRRFNVENVYGESEQFQKRERIINASNAMVLDSGKCVLCGRCVSACEKYAKTNVLAFNHRGNETIVGPAGMTNIDDSGCIYCGKCIQVCPVAAITERDGLDQLDDVLDDPRKYVVVQVAPAVRAALGEEFGYPIGTNVEGQMYAALEELGFDEIADVNWAADLTIIEEGTEFINRLKNNERLPMFTSCSPGWIRYIEQYEPDFIEHLSTAKSPQQMLGAMVKHYWAPKLGVDPKKVVTVSVMPCIAKKDEAMRPEMEVEGHRDVDIVITTRELARVIKRRNINFRELEEMKPQGQLAQFTGAGNIFGASGGVMEAALRTVTEILSKKPLPKMEFEALRGTDGIKEASLEIEGQIINVAVVQGGAAIKNFFEHLKKGEKTYHFVEFMGCDGGCVNGGGQPIIQAHILENIDVRQLRAKALYDEDAAMTLRQSHKNEAVQKAYQEFLGEPNSHKAHQLLHTHYQSKDYFSLHNINFDLIQKEAEES